MVNWSRMWIMTKVHCTVSARHRCVWHFYTELKTFLFKASFNNWHYVPDMHYYLAQCACSIFCDSIARHATEFEYECCQIPTSFCKSEIWWIFRLIQIRIQLSFWKTQVHHSSQSAVSHTKVNKYTLNTIYLRPYRLNNESHRNFWCDRLVYTTK